MRPLPFALLLLLACHSDPFGPLPQEQATPQDDPDEPGIRLTFNPHGNTEAEWTPDGRHVLYAYADVRGDRCHGLMPADAPRRIWELCDRRIQRGDSFQSYSAVAIGHDGRLLYQSSMSRPLHILAGLTGGQMRADRDVLWLADTAHPFSRRRALLTVPFGSGVRYVQRLAQARWIGPTSFTVLGQRLEWEDAPTMMTFDTIFVGTAVFRGEIGPQGATLTEVPGTLGTPSYALVGTDVIHAALDRTILRTPLAGGRTDTVAVLPESLTGTRVRAIEHLSCAGTRCAIATREGMPIAGTRAMPWAIWRVDLATGAVTPVRSYPQEAVHPFAALSPVNGDLLVPRPAGFDPHFFTLERILLLRRALP